MTTDTARSSSARLGYLRRLMALIVGVVLFWTGAAVVNLLACLFLPFMKRSRLRERARRILSGLFRIWMGVLTRLGVVRFECRDAVRLNEFSRTVVVANHPTLMDAFYLLSFIPNTVCVLKESLLHNPFLGPMARLCGFIANEAGPDLIREAGAALDDGCNLIIFPEGTRTRDSLGPFKPGFALIAIRYQAPVQAVHLRCVPPLFPGRVNLQGIPATCPTVSIQAGHLFSPANNTRALSLANEVEAYFRQPREKALAN